MMRYPFLIAALTLTTIGAGAAQADAPLPPGIEAAAGASATSGRSLDGAAPEAGTHPGLLKLAESEGHDRDDDDDDDDEDRDSEDEGDDDDAGGSPRILPTPQSGAPAAAPAPRNPLLNGNGRPSVVVQ